MGFCLSIVSCEKKHEEGDYNEKILGKWQLYKSEYQDGTIHEYEEVYEVYREDGTGYFQEKWHGEIIKEYFKWTLADDILETWSIGYPEDGVTSAIITTLTNKEMVQKELGERGRLYYYKKVN